MKVQVARVSGVGRLLQLLGVNSVPAVGFLGQGWSTGTTLVLYWVETVLVIALVAARIVLHRRVTRKAGHWHIPVQTSITTGGKTTHHQSETTFLAAFLGPMIVFTAGHGFLLALFLLLPDPSIAAIMAGVSPSSLAAGVPAMAAFLGLGFLMDLRGLRNRPFRWIERIASHALGRMMLTQVTLIFGMIAMGVWETPSAFFAVFVGLKTLMDLGSVLPERDVAAGAARRGSGRAALRDEAELRSRELKERVVDEEPAALVRDAAHSA